MESRKVVGEVTKNSRGEKIVVAEVLEDEVPKYIDIRQGFTSDEGDFILTKKGVRIKVEKFEELREVINSVMLN